MFLNEGLENKFVLIKNNNITLRYNKVLLYVCLGHIYHKIVLPLAQVILVCLALGTYLS